MDNLENEFNKRFKDQELPNDQFETEDLWNDIVNDMDDAKVVPASKFLSKRNLVLMIIGSFGFVAFLLFYIQPYEGLDTNSESVGANVESDNTVINSPSSLSANDIDLIEKTQTGKSVTTINDKSVSNTDVENSMKSISGKTETTLVEDRNTRPGLESNNRNILDNKVKSNSNDLEDEEKNINTVPSDIVENKTNVATKTASNAIDVLEDPKVDKIFDGQSSLETSGVEISGVETGGLETGGIESKNTDSIFSTRNQEPLPLLTSFQIDLNPTRSNKSSKPILGDDLLEEIEEEPVKVVSFYINAFTGVNALDYRFSSDNHTEIAMLKNESEKLYAGSSHALLFGSKFKNWTLSIGVEYHQLWSKFDYMGTREVPRTLDSVKLKIWVDANTGEELFSTIGEGIVIDTETRTVHHYNSIQRISVPLLFGFQKDFSRINFGLDFGPVFNFTTKQGGKTLEASQGVIEFDGKDFNSPFNTFDISLMVSPSLGFDISEKWQLVFAPQWRWSKSEYYSNSDFKVGKSQWNFNVGLRYTLF